LSALICMINSANILSSNARGMVFVNFLLPDLTLSDVDVLRFYVTEWDRYTTGVNYLNRLFTYLNRYWVECGRETRGKNTCSKLTWFVSGYYPVPP
jgi:hypothetical protein